MIKPLGKNVLIEKKTKETSTSFGLVLADDGKKKDEGLVQAIGDKVTDVKIGDTVLLRAWGGETVTSENKEYFVIEESQILAIVTE